MCPSTASSCPNRRKKRSRKSSISRDISEKYSTIGGIESVALMGTRFRSCFLGLRGRVKRYWPRPWQTNSAKSSIASICRALSINTSAKPRKIWQKYSTKRRKHKLSCCSTKPIRSSPSEPMSNRRTTAMPTSKSTSSSKSSNHTTASASSRRTCKRVSTRHSNAVCAISSNSKSPMTKSAKSSGKRSSRPIRLSTTISNGEFWPTISSYRAVTYAMQRSTPRFVRRPIRARSACNTCSKPPLPRRKNSANSSN